MLLQDCPSKCCYNYRKCHCKVTFCLYLYVFICFIYVSLRLIHQKCIHFCVIILQLAQFHKQRVCDLFFCTSSLFASVLFMHCFCTLFFIKLINLCESSVYCYLNLFFLYYIFEIWIVWNLNCVVSLKVATVLSLFFRADVLVSQFIELFIYSFVWSILSRYIVWSI